MQTAGSFSSFLQNNFKKVKLFFMVFYAVGIAGMLIPYTFPLFVKLIPLALLLSSVTLALFHQTFNTKSVILFAVIYFVGFFIEVTGVYTGIIFGHYIYGSSLGLKLFETPLIIGLNWLLLAYISASVFEKVKIHPALKIIGASVLMLGYDVITEQIAPVLDMWHWTDKTIPIQNFVAWFFMALVFQTAFRVFRIKTANRLAPVILICQILFFLILYISFKLLN